MRILYILHTTLNDGSTLSLKSLMEGVVRLGVSPVVLYPKRQRNENVAYLERLGCECHSYFKAKSAVPNNANCIEVALHLCRMVVMKVVSFISLYCIVKKSKPDIIHTNSGVVHEGYLIARTLKIPHVWHIREYQEMDCGWKIMPSKRIFEKELSKSYGIFITKDLQAFFHQDNLTSKVIYNPIYNQEDTHEVRKSGEKFFLIANRVSKEKGIEDIIRGYALFRAYNKEYQLKIAGQGSETYIEDLKKLCRELEVEDEVHFLGFISDIRELMYNAKILFVGSFYEGFGRMTAEANSLGTFVIGRNTGGTKEIVGLTQGGVLFDHYEEIPALLDQYLESGDGVMEEAKNVAMKYFSKDNHCKNVVQVYKEILHTEDHC